MTLYKLSVLIGGFNFTVTVNASNENEAKQKGIIISS